jgi:fused signal recognition particle receptor
MFDSLKKRLKEGVKKFSIKVAEKEEVPTFEEEEKFLHEKEVSTEEFLKEEPDKIEVEKESEEHFEEEVESEIPEAEEPEEPHKETIQERDAIPPPSMEDEILKKEEVLEKKGFLKKVRGIPTKIREKELTPRDIESFFFEIEDDLLQSNVAVEAVEVMKDFLAKELINKQIKRGQGVDFIRKSFEKAIFNLVNQGEIDFKKILKKEKPATLVFLGFNGSGKTTSIAKVADYLKKKDYGIVLAAGDTFRAASIEQLEHHGKKLKLKVIKHKYGSDAAAVIFDARKHAQSSGLDFVLADTAGRTHVDKNLMDELKKVIRVNKPTLKILVIDSLTGNDAVEQAKVFNEAANGVDAIMLTKIDVNKKGGSLLSVAHAIKKPILFLGTGQEYKDLIKFKPENFAKELLE